MDKLLDCARRLGVEIAHIPEWSAVRIDRDMRVPRPRLEIAMECLGKLPKKISNGLTFKWGFWYASGFSAKGEGLPFEEAVIALCNRGTI